ncbi:hypothetical protein GWK47_006527 [Chionoecetes opilio]|uniref:Uncharacterized protein n=1 Tax=Chionoecetes opilio TaxID=41210 RepID=A0A8J4Y5R9_CHIOP|nr:hypothetical protein GWK47_006527 [Chionoecetes opilio]
MEQHHVNHAGLSSTLRWLSWWTSEFFDQGDLRRPAQDHAAPGPHGPRQESMNCHSYRCRDQGHLLSSSQGLATVIPKLAPMRRTGATKNNGQVVQDCAAQETALCDLLSLPSPRPESPPDDSQVERWKNQVCCLLLSSPHPRPSPPAPLPQLHVTTADGQAGSSATSYPVGRRELITPSRPNGHDFVGDVWGAGGNL